MQHDDPRYRTIHRQGGVVIGWLVLNTIPTSTVSCISSSLTSSLPLFMSAETAGSWILARLIGFASIPDVGGIFTGSVTVTSRFI